MQSIHQNKPPSQSDREMLFVALGGLRDIGDTLLMQNPGEAFQLVGELASQVHQHLAKTEGAA